jgi:hypothetical protein
LGESGLQEALFAELAAGAGVRAYGVPSHAGGLPANTGERRGGEKWTKAREFGRLGGGLIGVLLSSAKAARPPH